MDVRMPELDGIAATRELGRRRRAAVLMLTTFDLDEYVYDALRAGASGFLLKDAPPDRLVEAIHAVARRRRAARAVDHAAAGGALRGRAPARRRRPGWTS